ncbi:MAG: hypothetical protein M1828_000109 [Chrysothrix sp. TS-e1954]|nr:MAG: hypothetical protein M1828_000109 [Chrysothrix sp. TS-e1954]
MPYLTHLLSILSILGILLTTVTAALEDPNIYCHADELPPLSAPWPRNRSPNLYTPFEPLSLCSIAWGAPLNLGCICISGLLNCGLLGDQVLSNAKFASSIRGQEGFEDWCRYECGCTDKTAATLQRAFPTVRVVAGAGSSNNGTDEVLTGSGGGALGIADFNNHGSNDLGELETPAAGCGGNCTSNVDCDHSSCRCKTVRTTYIPGGGFVHYGAVCSAISGKREEERPCACNTTYVSWACCGASDGYVWEAERFKLGELGGYEL